MAKTNLDNIMLAYALGSKQFALELSNAVTFEYFHAKVQWLYKATIEHFNDPKYKELPTENVIQEYLTKNFSQTSFVEEGLKYFRGVTQLETNPAEFNWYLEKLKRRFNDKLQRDCASNIVKLIQDQGTDIEARTDKINEILKESITAIDAIYKRQAYNEGPLSDSAIDRLKRYKEVRDNPEVAQGVLTGFSELDRITNGLHPGEFCLIGGSTGTGKSVMMHNMAVNAYLGKNDPFSNDPPEQMTGGKNVLYFSLEMPKATQERRIDACMAGIIANEIRDGKLDEDSEKKYRQVLKFQAKYPYRFHIVDMPRGVTVREIELKYVEIRESLGIEFDQVYSDYIGLMKPNNPGKGDSDWLELGHVAEEFHEFLRAYKISGVSASQLNRPKDPNKPQTSTDRFARSSMLPDNVNIALQIACRGDDEHTRLDMPVYITKMRDGEKGSFTLTRDFARMKVVDLTDASFGDGDDDDDLGI